MSSKNTNIYNKKYDTYNKLIVKVLEERRLSQSWLLRNIIEEGQKESSLQSQISRWFSEKKIDNNEAQPVGFDYRKKINNALDINVKKNSKGRWEVARTKDPVSEKINQLERKIDDEGVDYNAQDQLLEYLEDRTESLSQELAEMNLIMKRLRLAMKKNHSDD